MAKARVVVELTYDPEAEACEDKSAEEIVEAALELAYEGAEGVEWEVHDGSK